MYPVSILYGGIAAFFPNDNFHLSGLFQETEIIYIFEMEFMRNNYIKI